MIAPGTCRHCGRSEGNLLRGSDGDEAGWGDRTQTWCTFPSCVVAEAQRLRRARQAARPESEFRGWGKGAIRLELERRARARRRKGRAA